MLGRAVNHGTCLAPQRWPWFRVGVSGYSFADTGAKRFVAGAFDKCGMSRCEGSG
ncbi:unnamed protein product [Ixodes persulcatus]